jgi:hypothetical protein
MSATRVGSQTGNLLPLCVSALGMIKYAANLWFDCNFPAAAVPLMPPSHNSDASLLMFANYNGIPFGFISLLKTLQTGLSSNVYMYLMFGRGNLFTWSSSVLFMTAVYLPKLFEYRKQTSDKPDKDKNKKADLTKEGKGFIFKDGKVIETDAPEGVTQQFIIHASRSAKKKTAEINDNRDEDDKTSYQDLRKCSYYILNTQ